MTHPFIAGDTDPSNHTSWEYIGEVPDRAHLFEDPYGKQGFTYVHQGQEEISAGNFLHSSGFQQCSARVLLNMTDSSVLLKHVGPKNFMEEGEGMLPQDPYRYFLENAARDEARVLSLDVFGTLSRHRVRQPSELTIAEPKIITLPEIHVDTGTDYNWSLIISPKDSTVIIGIFDKDLGHRYLEYRLPYSYDIAQSDLREAIVLKVDKKRKLDRAVAHLGRIPLSSPEFIRLEETISDIDNGDDLIGELREWQLSQAGSEWSRTFARHIEIVEADPTQAEDLSQEATITALDVLLDLKVRHIASDDKKTRKALIFHSLLFDTVERFRGMKPAIMLKGGRILLEYYDSLVGALGDPDLLTDEADRKVYPYLIREREFVADFIFERTGKRL